MTLIWRPEAVVDSKDGDPLAVRVADLVVDFPYDRLPENQFVAFFLRPESLNGLVTMQQILLSKFIM